MSTHTPGPWTVTQEDKWPFRLTTTAAGGTVIATDDLLTYSTADRSAAEANRREGNAEHLANIRLRAAAPEMLEALDDIAILVSYIVVHGVGEQPPPREDGCPQPVRVSFEELEKIIHKIGNTARAAIAKAERSE